MQAYGDDTSALFQDVASSLASSRWWRLRVGDFEATVRLLEELVSGSHTEQEYT
jgi:hypothetical protein